MRLTLWYGLTFALALAVIAGVLHLTLSRILEFEIDRSLADRSFEVNRAVRLDSAPDFGVQLRLPRPNAYANADTFVQIATLEGRVVAMSDNLERRPLPIDDLEIATANRGEVRFNTVEVSGERLRVLTSPLLAAGQPIGVLQVARALWSVETLLARLQFLLVVAIMGSLFFALIGGWLLARAALAPIDRVTQTAGLIGDSRDFGRRLESVDPPDEIGRLSATFNSMLGQLQAAYAELQSANERLAENLAAQRRFIADASHELRTPLTTIRGNAGLLKQVADMSPEDREESLEQIAGESERMSRLVQQLLVLARADSGLLLSREAVVLDDLTREVVRQIATIAPEIELSLDAPAEVIVMGDRDYLKQLLLILLDNAVKYTPAGGRVSIEVRPLAADPPTTAPRAIVRVADSGVGIAADDLPHVFERFFRADRARQGGGTGLGLAIAKWIVEEHRGSITVESEVGVGSTFVVELPLGSDRACRPPAAVLESPRANAEARGDAQ